MNLFIIIKLSLIDKYIDILGLLFQEIQLETDLRVVINKI